MSKIEELRKKLLALDKERDMIWKDICRLEEKEAAKQFNVGECYIDAFDWDYPEVYKIIAICEEDIYYVKLEETKICKGDTTAGGTTHWSKITTEQFDAIRDAVLADIQNPDWGTIEKSEWESIVQPIIKSIYQEYKP